MPAHPEVEPEFRVPRLGCDAHFHVFGPTERYPYGTGISEKLRYTPPVAPLEDYLAFARRVGLERFVFVQPSAYGRRQFLHARCNAGGPRQPRDRRCGRERRRRGAGAAARRGGASVRINTSPVKPPEAGYAATLLPRIERLEARCREIGWSLDFLNPGWLTTELMGTLRHLRVDFTVAHMGMYLAKDGVSQPGFQQLLDLLRSGEGVAGSSSPGSTHVHRSGFTDVAPMVEALLAAAADRLIWGSDYPHLSFADRAGSVALLNLLGRWVPDASNRHKILVDNPIASTGSTPK